MVSIERIKKKRQILHLLAHDYSRLIDNTEQKYLIFSQLSDFLIIDVTNIMLSISTYKLMKLIISHILTSFILAIVAAGQFAPTWITSNYIQTGLKKVIDGDACNCKTGNSSTPTATLAFTTAFTAVPNLGYGITSYQGDDYLYNQMFEVNRTGLTLTTFSVKVQISSITNIWVLEVRYVVIDKAFPHHLNSFDNVPINYANGALTNITVRNGSTKSYTNIVNYTAQAISIGSPHQYFSLPLTNNKILTFMTSLFIQATFESGTTPLYNVDLWVSATPWSAETYRLYATLGPNANISRLHFSMITFDQTQVQSSGAYLLVYERIQYGVSGGYYNFPSQFLPNFMVGFTQFSSLTTKSSIHFILNFVTVSGAHRLQMLPVVTRAGSASITRYNYTIFYLKTWLCPVNTVFDPLANMCISCLLSNCLTCFNTTVCSVCNSSNKYYLNSTTGLCQPCSIAGCITCASLTTCSDCNETLNYVLASTTCSLCLTDMNYFPEVASQTCVLCSLSNCINCSSLNQCRQCNSGASYYVQTNGTCSYCDPVINKFINPVTKDCVSCPVSNCQVCSSYSACQACNLGYLLDSTSNLCYSCTLPGCYHCSSPIVCSICSQGYYLNSGSCTVCTITGCINCTGSLTCSQCDQTNHYLLISSTCTQCSPGSFPNNATSACQVCSLSNCLSCLTLTTCSTCDTVNSFYLLPTNICAYCDPSLDTFINSTSLNCQACSIAFCIDCASLTSCVQCNSLLNYFVNAMDNLCYSCSITNCHICSSLAVCSLCNLGYYADSGTGQCQPCTIAGCKNCSDSSTCVQCDETLNYVLIASNHTCSSCPIGYFANSTTQICQNCNIQGCLICSSLTSCQTCDTINSYYATVGGCGFCNTSLNTFINLTSLNCQPCLIPHCISCSSLTSCSICNTSINYFVNSTTGLCQQCTIPNCLNCNSLLSCSQCDVANNYGLDYTSPNQSLCGGCSVSCSCDGYGLPWDPIAQKCTPICGDGIIRGGQQCDDANTLSSDGCSMNCRIEHLYTCISEPSFCYFYYYIHGSFVQVEKAGCNIFKATVYAPGFTFSQIAQDIFVRSPKGLNIVDRKQNMQYIDIYVQYGVDLINQIIYMDFSPGQTIEFNYSSTTPAIHYSQQECQGNQKSQQIMDVTQICSYVILVLSLLSCKIVGLELFGVLQLSFFTLSSHDFLNIYLAPLVNFKTFNGLNINLISQSSLQLTRLKQMNLSSNFLNNCNIMLMILFVELTISFTLYLIGKFTVNPKVKNIGLQLLKQGFITLVLFNSFNIAFSAGIHLKFANPNDPGYAASTVILFFTLICLVLSVFAMQITSKQDYGQFKLKFKNNCICGLYIPLTVCYRICLGFYCAYQNSYEFNSLIIMAFAFFFLMYFIVNLPFSDAYQNYRACLIHITMLVILLTTNYYRNMKYSTPIEQKAKIHTPAIIELVLIMLSLFVSFLVLTYELYRFIVKLRTKKKLLPNPQIPSEITHQNIDIQI